jgi:hypothetical protein
MRIVVTSILALLAGHGCSSDKSSDPLSGIEVKVESSGEGMWKVSVANHQKGTIQIAWDASSYVGADGKSLGRLIRGETRRIDVGKPQPATPVAPSASIEEDVIPESYTDDMARLKPDENGTMYLAFESESGKQTWHGHPVQDPNTIPLTSGFYCTTPKVAGGEEFCARVLAHCENGRATGARSAGKPGAIDEVMGPCTNVASARCFDFTPKSVTGEKIEPVERCFVATEMCAKQRSTLAPLGTATDCAERK